MTIKRGLRLLIPTVLLGSGVFWRLACPPAANAADADLAASVPVSTVAAQVRDVPELLNGLGTVQPLNVVQVTAQVNGALIALPIQQGHEVHKGDIIAEIDPRPYKAALDQATAQHDEDAALLQSATLDLHRYADLAKRSFASRQQVDDQQATVAKDTAAVALDNAAIETAKINLGYCVIRAPIDGHVSFYQVTIGNIVQANGQAPIMSITQDRPISVVLTLPESDLPRIQAARAKGNVPVIAVDGRNDNKVLANGTLLTPNNAMDTTTGTISLKAVFGNDDDHLWPGQFVDARVQVGVLSKAVTVPVVAVQHGPDGLFVYVVKPDRTVDQVNIEVSYQDDGLAVVSKGLSENATVVTSGQSRLAPGTRVRVAPSPSPQASAGTQQPT
ncbi:MAG TPA: efflux RND transporter periplasmic adaptor subunit [Rhodopila sp.]|jgi:multidrug efflux system membrane fusion protein|nr:efflux RND transporter periplasmic adaptor subunit [Rhodopila sp.]